MRQPVQTLYGGAHLFRPDSVIKLGGLARKSWQLHGPVGSSARTHERVGLKLETEPIEDLRIDFEDGYGVRSDAEGFFQSWDLHPAHLPARYAAIYDTYLDHVEPTAARLQNFLKASARATALGAAFDDAATMLGYRIFFRRAVECGAISGEEAVRYTTVSAP